MRDFKLQPAKNQDGLVALFVVGIMIILLSLTTVAFTQLMGRESRQSLDRALSTQAYYAAQSGINDAADYVTKNPSAILGTTACGDLAQKGYPPFLGPSNTVNDGVDKVTCVTINTAPSQLAFPSIQPGETKIFKMTPVTNKFGRILFSWDNAGTDESSFDGKNYKDPTLGVPFDTNIGWNTKGGNTTAPALEVTYYPMQATGQSLTTLQSNSRTIYLYPSTGGYSQYNGSTQPDGLIVGRSCQSNPNLSSVFDGATTSSTFHCNTIVTPKMPGNIDPTFIFVKITAFYDTAKVAVSAVDDSTAAGKATNIKDGQVVLDSTGQGGSDVLKRLQTVMDYSPPDVPADAVQSVVGLCKRIEQNLTTGQVQLDGSVQGNDTDGSNTNQACHTADLN